MTQETKEKLRQANLGKKMSNDAKMRKMRSIKTLVRARDNDICQMCQEFTLYPQVDHIQTKKDYPELILEMSNLRTLCMPCHYFITYKRKIPNNITWGHFRRVA